MELDFVRYMLETILADLTDMTCSCGHYFLLGTSYELTENRRINLLWDDIYFEMRCPECGNTIRTALKVDTKRRKDAVHLGYRQASDAKVREAWARMDSKTKDIVVEKQLSRLFKNQDLGSQTPVELAHMIHQVLLIVKEKDVIYVNTKVA